MTILEVRDLALSLPGATEDMPYGPDWIVMRIQGKIFVHLNLVAIPPTIALKLPPERNLELRERYQGIAGAYHLNKTHWSDVCLFSDVPEPLIGSLIRQSYLCVLKKLPKNMKENHEISIRKAREEDLDEVSLLEQLCFPKAEAATRASFKERLEAWAGTFWILEKDGKIISFIQGPVTFERDLLDEMYHDTSFHNPTKGLWQMIFGVVTHPEHQKKGYASLLMEHVKQECRSKNLKGLVLTCKQEKLPFYSRLGFKDEGVSSSEHGGVIWHQMRLEF